VKIFPGFTRFVNRCKPHPLATLRTYLAESSAALRGAFRNPGIRRIELAYLGSAVGLYANVVAVAVYAYHHGGATAVGLVMFARMGIAALAAPFTSALADRHPQRRVMLTADLARVVTVGVTAIAAASHASALVYVLAVLTSVVSTAFRPAEASLTPLLAETPEELSAANVASSTFDSVGAFAGPAAGALLLALGGPTLAFACIAVTYVWSAWFVARIPHAGRPVAPDDTPVESEGFAAGVRAVRSEPRLALVLGLYSAQTLVAGAYGVLVVVVALQLLGLGNGGVGLLQAATGVGALAGAAAALALVGRRRTGADLQLGLCCFGAPLLLVAAVPRTWAAVLALGILGVGNSLVDISAVTLVQRTAPPAVAGRVFGVLEAALVGAIGIGAVLTPVLVHVVGVRGTLVVVGAVLPALALVAWRAVARIDASAVVPEEQLRAIAVVPFLAVLPVQQREALALALERVELPAGATLFSQGDAGDRLYILTAGALEIDLASGPKREEAPAFVGEIALLRDVPRTATVRAPAASTLWALDGPHFLAVVAGHARSRTAADAVLATRGVAFGV
jgi:MFS family permease